MKLVMNANALRLVALIGACAAITTVVHAGHVGNTERDHDNNAQQFDSFRITDFDCKPAGRANEAPYNIVVKLEGAKPMHKVLLAGSSAPGTAPFVVPNSDSSCTGLQSGLDSFDLTIFERADINGDAKIRVPVDSCSGLVMQAMSAPYRSTQCVLSNTVAHGPTIGLRFTMELEIDGVGAADLNSAATWMRFARQTLDLPGSAVITVQVSETEPEFEPFETSSTRRRALLAARKSVYVTFDIAEEDKEEVRRMLLELKALFVTKVKGNDVRNNLKKALVDLGIPDAKKVVLSHSYEVLDKMLTISTGQACPGGTPTGDCSGCTHYSSISRLDGSAGDGSPQAISGFGNNVFCEYVPCGTNMYNFDYDDYNSDSEGHKLGVAGGSYETSPPGGVCQLRPESAVLGDGSTDWQTSLCFGGPTATDGLDTSLCGTGGATGQYAHWGFTHHGNK